MPRHADSCSRRDRRWRSCTVRPRAGLVVAVLAATLVATGCGGGALSKADYEQQVGDIGQRAGKQLQAFERGDASAERLEAVAEALDDAADDLGAVDSPPEDVAKLHDELVDALRDGAKLMRDFAPVMRQMLDDPAKVDPDDLDAMTKRIEAMSARIERIESGFESAGYDIRVVPT